MYPGSTAIILNCSSLFLSYHPIPERDDTRPNRLYYDSTWDIMMHTFMTLEKTNFKNIQPNRFSSARKNKGQLSLENPLLLANAMTWKSSSYLEEREGKRHQKAEKKTMNQEWSWQIHRVALTLLCVRKCSRGCLRSSVHGASPTCGVAAQK